MVSDYLTAAGFVVERRFTGRDGLAALDGAAFDAVILDVMLPDIDGFEVCRTIRTRAETPILMLTARGEEMDRIVGLEIGADDYLAKPFSPRELQARIRAILRRSRAPAADAALRFGRLAIDRESRTVRVDGEEKTLTSYQFDLLAALADNAGRVLNRERLLGSRQGRGARSLRSLDRRSRLAHPRRDRGRSQAPAPHHHRARRRLCLRQEAGRRVVIGVRRRLFWKVYLTLLSSLVAVAFLMGAFWWLIGESHYERWGPSHVQLDDWSIPARDDPPGAVAAAMTRLGDELGADISVYDARRRARRIARRADPARGGRRSRRTAVAGHARRPSRRPGGAGAVAPAGPEPAAAHPDDHAHCRGRRRTGGLSDHRPTDATARRPALRRRAMGRRRAVAARRRRRRRRSRRRRAHVQRFGRPRRRSCWRRRRRLLANASHELRSPLARLRLAIELWFASPSPEMHAEIVRNLAESDQLVEEILLASRLDHAGPNAARADPRRSARARRRGGGAHRRGRDLCVRRRRIRSRSTATRHCCGG